MSPPKLPPWPEPLIAVTLPDGTQAAVEMPRVWRTWFEQMAELAKDHEARIVVLEP